MPFCASCLRRYGCLAACPVLIAIPAANSSLRIHFSCSPRRLSLQPCPVRLFLGHELDYEIDTPIVPCTRVILQRQWKMFDKSPIHPCDLSSRADPNIASERSRCAESPRAARRNLVHANKPVNESLRTSTATACQCPLRVRSVRSKGQRIQQSTF